jgi:aminoglycoside 3-N-acetyltransferase
MHLQSELGTLGLPVDAIYLVHCSLRQLGPLAGGAATLLQVLHELLGPESTIVVPAFSARNSTTTRRFRRHTAGMTLTQVAAEEAKIDGFDPARTPAQDVGAFAEYVRVRAGTVRSNHPQTSFAALGPAASTLMRDHPLDCHLGERSPLAKLYAAAAVVLQVGAELDGACTCFHLAEHRLERPASRRLHRTYVIEDGRRRLVEFMAAGLDDSDFDRLGAAMRTQTEFVHCGSLGQTTASWFPLRAAVDFAADWMTRCRTS